MRLAVLVLLLVAIIYLLSTRGGFLASMTLEGAGGSKLAQFMSYHFFGAIYRNVFSSVVNRNGAAYEFGEYGGRTGPGFNYPFIGSIHLGLNSV